MLLFHLAKVRNYVVCHDCGKRRVVYSAAKLTREQENAVSRVKEELLFSCGNPLFPGGNFQDIIIVKEGGSTARAPWRQLTIQVLGLII